MNDLHTKICCASIEDAGWLSWQSSGFVTGNFRVQNQVDALLPFGKALILITKGEGPQIGESISGQNLFSRGTRFTVTATKKWNDLPSFITSANSTDEFKKLLKSLSILNS